MNQLNSAIFEEAQPALDVVERHHVRRQVAIEIGVGEKPLLLAELDEFSL
jgi:hypothetical protein